MTTQSSETPKTGEPGKERIFVADNRQFPDPDSSLSVEQVRQMLADFMPELHNAEVKQTEKDGKTYVQFLKKVGTKGC